MFCAGLVLVSGRRIHRIACVYRSGKRVVCVCGSRGLFCDRSGGEDDYLCLRTSKHRSSETRRACISDQVR